MSNPIDAIRYDVAGTLDGLAHTVNESISKGWQPYGPVQHGDEAGELWFAQAVVKFYQEPPARYFMGLEKLARYIVSNPHAHPSNIHRMAQSALKNEEF